MSPPLRTGERVVIVANQAAFQSLYGTSIRTAGVFSGQLAHGGEKIHVDTAAGQEIEEFSYQDGWYPSTDGNGYSLVALDPNADQDTLSGKDGWRASQQRGGNPGAADVGLLNNNSVVINEVMTNPTSGTPWIELANTTSADIDVSGWFLSDSSATTADLMKWALPAGTIVPQGGFVTFTQPADFGGAFTLSAANGGKLYLSSSDGAGGVGGYRDSVNFTASDPGVSFGRYVKPTGDADFTAMSPTLGASNGPPLVGPIVINEIMYHPRNGGDEFIELKNISGSAVSLNDGVSAWKFTDGIDFAFPAGASIAAGGLALVVPNSPATFRSVHGIIASVPIFGPYSKVLNDGGETLELSKPGPGGPAAPYVVVDHVNYDTNGNWTVQADGNGSSLQRRVPGAYGNIGTNWMASRAGGTPGQENVEALAPVITANPASGTIIQGGVLRVAGSFADADAGDSWTATVDWGDGLPLAATLNADKTFTLSHNFARNGDYNVLFTITDSQGLRGTASWQVAATATGRPAPTASMSGPAAATEGGSGLSLSFSGQADLAAGNQSTIAYYYSYDFNNDGVFEVLNSASASAAIPGSYFDGPGTQLMLGRVADAYGGFAQFTANITVASVAPTATISNNGPVNEGSAVTVGLANAYDPSSADTKAGFHYSFAQSTLNLATTYAAAGTSSSAPFTFGVNGTYTVYARIFDKDSAYTQYSTTITVNNVAPTVAAGPDISVPLGLFQASGSFSDPGLETWTANVDYGDGKGPLPLIPNADKTLSLSTTYTSPGTYTVTLTVNDGHGGIGADALVVTVQPRVRITGAGQEYTLARDAGGALALITGPGGAPAYTMPLASTSTLVFEGAAASTLSVDFTAGSPIPAGGVSFSGGNPGNVLHLIAPTGGVLLDGAGVLVGTARISTANVGQLDLDGGGATSSLVFAAAPAVADVLISSGHLQWSSASPTITAAVDLTVEGASTVNIATSARLASATIDGSSAQVKLTGGAGEFVRARSVSILDNGLLDLATGDLIVDSSSLGKWDKLTELNGWIATGRSGGTWSGRGITSSSAAGDLSGVTGLAAIVNEVAPLVPVRTELDGQSLGPDDIVVKYTCNGDANLDGLVNADDYFQIDQGYRLQGDPSFRGYFHGDFDYGGSITADDYYLIDRAFVHRPACWLPGSNQPRRLWLGPRR